jgi:integrase
LTTATEIKTVAGEEGRIAQYEWKCRKRGLQQNTIELRKYHLARLVEKGADLNNPETVETVLAINEYPIATKWLLVNAYRSYCRMFNVQWEPIKVKYQPKMPYIPTQEECHIFIGGLSRTVSILCRLLLETGCRIGEAHKIEWTDINEENCTIAINHPEKNSNARIIRVTRDLIDLLKLLSRNHGNHVFNPTIGAYDGVFYRQRKRIAEKNGKPQLLKIHFHTFRHVRASIDCLNGIPLIEVKETLGHKSILNTEKYVHWNKQLYQQKNDRYLSASVSTDEEAGQLIEAGWLYVCNNPTSGRMLFRKPK